MKLIDLTGEKFGRLTVVSRAPSKNKRTYWSCMCDCGNACTVEGYNLTSGKTKSCGCFSAGTRKFENMSESRLYHIWEGMIRRCEKPKRENYKYYGGRGIKVCPEWHDFSKFQMWAFENGYEDYLTIERKNGNGDYCPENCCWASWEEQNNNRRNNRILEIAGVKMTLTQAAGIYGVSRTTVYKRLADGLPIEKALGIKPGVHVKLSEICGGETK